ncbi:hypothetical protein E2I00_011238, partial [Balaenoptera physalus]
PNPYRQSVSLSVGCMVKVKADLVSLWREPRICGEFLLYTNTVVVMNSFQEGGWREEEKASSDPFVFVNNKSTYVFTHRLPSQSVKMLEVKGDIVLTSVELC